MRRAKLDRVDHRACWARWVQLGADDQHRRDFQSRGNRTDKRDDRNFFFASRGPGESSGFARWGGAVTFDNRGTTNWNFDHTSLASSGRERFLLSSTSRACPHSWLRNLDGMGRVGRYGESHFYRCRSDGRERRVPVPLQPDLAHLESNLMSTIPGTSIMQRFPWIPTLPSAPETDDRTRHCGALRPGPTGDSDSRALASAGVWASWHCHRGPQPSIDPSTKL